MAPIEHVIEFQIQYQNNPTHIVLVLECEIECLISTPYPTPFCLLHHQATVLRSRKQVESHLLHHASAIPQDNKR